MPSTKIDHLLKYLFATTLIFLTGCNSAIDFKSSTSASNEQDGTVVLPKQGDDLKSGGSPNIRKAFTKMPDVAVTTNDESNDQPLGHFGMRTIQCTYSSSGNSYPLDADIDGTEVKRVYFEKGGWVDFDESEIDESGVGHGTDEQGKDWEFEGFVSEPDEMSSSSEPYKYQEDH